MKPLKNHSSIQEHSALPQSIRIPTSAPAIAREGIGLGIQGRSITEKAVLSPKAELGLKICTVVEIGAWAVCGLATFAFAVILITPLLVPLLSMGSVFSDGWKEWLEFAITAWKMSINPALVALTTGALAMAVRKGKAQLESRFSADDEKNDELRRLEKLMPPKIAH